MKTIRILAMCDGYYVHAHRSTNATCGFGLLYGRSGDGDSCRIVSGNAPTAAHKMYSASTRLPGQRLAKVVGLQWHIPGY